MFPELAQKGSIKMQSSKSVGKSQFQSPRSPQEVRKEAVAKNLSPRPNGFKPIDFRENLIININSTETLRVKEYKKL